MHTFVWALVVLDWLVCLTWLWRVVVWRQNLHRVPDLAAAEPMHGALPRLSVIVPARNEEAGIDATLRSLLASEGVNLEIIAVDDRSTDQTGVLMDRLAGDHLHVLHVSELPAQWLGKTHAMSLGAGRAAADWLLFTDGDVVFHPQALRRALAFAIARGADHMVLAPTVVLRSAGERMMIAWLHVLSLLAVRPWNVPDPAAKRDAVGVGAFNMVRREVYEAMGGWAAFRMEVVEDVVFGRRLKARGFRPQMAFGVDLVRVRWAEGAMGVVGNLTKNLFALFRFRPELLLAAAFAMGLFSLFPLGMCLVARAAWWPLGVLLVALTLAYQRAGRFHHFRAAEVLLYPVASGLLIFALLRSMILALWLGGVYWRGTFYALQELRPARELLKGKVNP